MTERKSPPPTHRILVKLRPTDGSRLRLAGARAGLRPLFDAGSTPPNATGASPQRNPLAFASAATPRWFLADLPDLPDHAVSPWDSAHARIADQLGLAEDDILHAEPDIAHNIYVDANEVPTASGFAAGADCAANAQDHAHGKPQSPSGFAWHLGDSYSQLGRARDAVTFSDPRTRIGHIDTGYMKTHVTAPAHLRHDLERNFVDDDHPHSAEDPDNHRLILDNSGHGTGTLSILAGGPVPSKGDKIMGGAPEAEVVPLRIADTVVLFHTSAFAQALQYAIAAGCDVVTLSMGGLPSDAWRETVDLAYDNGLCIVAAAGNNTNGFPTRHVVYPARYGRVIAVAGVMANHQPYRNLRGASTIEGNYGPKKVMGSAVSAYTPNIPWAKYPCPDVVRLNGEGTSSATPQVAAAVALWFEKYKHVLPRDWRRIEAVREALFKKAKAKQDKSRLGNGILQAFTALGHQPRLNLPKTKSDSDSWAFLRVITGLGITEPTPRERMFELEVMQRWMQNPELQKAVPDPEAIQTLDDKTMKSFMGALIDDPGASVMLRRHVAARYPVAVGQAPPPSKPSGSGNLRIVPETEAACDDPPEPHLPAYRRLRVYAIDPSLSTKLATASIHSVTLKTRWESLKPGPLGEYLDVEDTDASGHTYDKVDLDDPRLLARDGWDPSEGNPQFHQQMVYTVAMKTIEHFEGSLGRPVLWRPKPNARRRNDDRTFVQRLKIRPHALRQANAFYSPQEVALLFGYFEASHDAPGDHMPGSRVYTCLSHDIVVHETTHAILDGMHRRFNEPTNPDVLALHEGFADIVALMQHFCIPEILTSEIRRTRGDLEAESMLGSLALQFGRAAGGRGALRNAIGRLDENGRWVRLQPDPAELSRRLAPHGRGAILVAAVFDAFLSIYKSRISDLLRLATSGTGILPSGAIHPDLVRRLADEATKSAGHVLNMCIRALDYLPPVDVTFFEYLRALITADFDLVADDKHNYRVAFVEAFRNRGIYPADLENPGPDTPRTLAVDTLRWKGLDETLYGLRGRKSIEKRYVDVIDHLKEYADQCLYITDRRTLFDVTRKTRISLHAQLKPAFKALPGFAETLGLVPEKPFEVHALRRAMRVGPDGRHLPQVVLALTQSKRVRRNAKTDTPAHVFRGGSTLIVDLTESVVKYRIIKNIASDSREERAAAFVRENAADPLRAMFLDQDGKEPFRLLHGLG